MVLKEPYPALEKDIATLIGPRFMRTTPLERFWELPRYLRAMKLRAEKWKKNPQKDAERARQLSPYLSVPPQLRWLVEEFRVSLFAQELGTSEPISAVKLDQALASLKPKAGQVSAAAERPALQKPPPKLIDKPVPVVVRLNAAEGKSKPLKSLNNLDKFFSR
jgi:ATP-dependent helicase HrpA